MGTDIMICSKCSQPLPHLTINGVAYRAVKKTHIPKRYVWVGDDEVLCVLPITLLIVDQIGTAPPKQPTTEAEAEQP